MALTYYLPRLASQAGWMTIRKRHDRHFAQSEIPSNVLVEPRPGGSAAFLVQTKTPVSSSISTNNNIDLHSKQGFSLLICLL
jgi:hypothetical protein